MTAKLKERLILISEVLSDSVPIVLALGGVILGLGMLITDIQSPEVSTIASSAIAGASGLARIDKKDDVK